MATRYFYCGAIYLTEAEAQSAAVLQKARLQNNPTDWIVVKEISGSQESGWQINPNPLTDDQINNIDVSKNYLIASVVEGENIMPATSSEVTAKVLSYRPIYADHIRANIILSDLGVTDLSDGEIIPTDVDMSDYMS